MGGQGAEKRFQDAEEDLSETAQARMVVGTGFKKTPDSCFLATLADPDPLSGNRLSRAAWGIDRQPCGFN
jgi:hypothetical protein